MVTTKKKPNPKRVIEKPRYKSLRLHKRIASQQKVTGALRLFKQSILHIAKYWKLFLGITLIYFVLSLLLVTGFSIFNNSNLADTKVVLDEFFTGIQGQLTTGLALFGVIASGGTSASSEVGGVYQTLLMIFVSLVVIWALRQTYAGEKTSIKQAFYKSTYPLVPFVLVLFVIALQLLPLLGGAGLYSRVIGGGLAVTLLEKVLWLMLFVCLALLSLYMISSSVFALYIVTLPNMMPMKALRSARELVRYRRWSIMRKLLFLPIVLILLSAIIMIPILLYITVVAQWVFLFISLLGIVIVHAYIYALYRELL